MWAVGNQLRATSRDFVIQNLKGMPLDRYEIVIHFHDSLLSGL